MGRLVSAVLLFFVMCGGLNAEGNLVKRAVRLDTLNIDALNGFSVRTYELETGVFYRWRIHSDGKDEYKLVAPEFFEIVWVEQVSIDDLEVKPAGLRAVEFDDEGEMDIYFLPVVPGEYEFYIEHLKGQGFSGTMVVK